ncbi:MAG TPA: hypothetical protein VIE42_10605 [Steroidobacteraceae bacterium]
MVTSSPRARAGDHREALGTVPGAHAVDVHDVQRSARHRRSPDDFLDGLDT